MDAGLAAIAVRLDPTARSVIDGHVRLLLAWNDAINLTAVRDPATIAIRHVVDSLTASQPLQRLGIGSVVDLGSGGGYPGVPLAAVMPRGETLLVESVAKKARFLSTVVHATGLDERVRVAAVRAESLSPRDVPDGAAVTVRAVASLADLVELALPILAPGLPLIAWKSAAALEGPGGELAAASRAVAAIDPAAEVDVLEPVSGRSPEIVEALRGHRLVLVTRSRRSIDRGWPRSPAQRRRRPW